MKIDSHGNGNGLNDLYILPETEEETKKVMRYIEDNGLSYQWSRANVQGHEWYGKRFIEIPFGEAHKSKIMATN